MSDSVLRLSLFDRPNYAFLLTARLLSTMAVLAESVTVGWQVYDIARHSYDIEQSSFLVGMIGLMQFAPMFAMTLPAGESVDRYDRRKILLICFAVQFVCAACLAWLALHGLSSLLLLFGIAAFQGLARAFAMPALTALGPMLVHREELPRAIAWSSLATQFGMVIGPWIGGLLSARSIAGAYTVVAILFGVAAMALVFIRSNTRPEHKGGSRAAMIHEGLAYVWTNKIVLGAISLDLFAVLLGGVTSLLPVFARDVLHVGPEGFGLLRSAIAIGGGGMAFALAFRPLQGRPGVWLLSAVAVFGAATLVFALSTTLVLSVLALTVAGAADSISVFVRQSLVQIHTPDHMRGRVAAVSSVFISASNELGEFESGLAARVMGPIGAALFGGAGSILVTIVWAHIFPALRRADRLGE